MAMLHRSIRQAALCILACWVTFLPSGKATEPKSRSTITGEVVGVADGDTITVLDSEKKQHKIRLEGIDAPEIGQPFGTTAKKVLSDKVFGKSVKVVDCGTDKYRRTLGHVYIGDKHVNLELVEEGCAWHFKKYSDDKELAAAEVSARKVETGLWADKSPIAPWDFRNGVGSDSGNEADKDSVYVTKTGTKYHRASCRSLSKSRIAVSLDEAKKKYSPCSICKPPK